MELRQLEHFVAVAEERHFTRAARRVNIVQSGLSASIRALERELGTSLFVRSTRQVELTEAGRALLVEARRTLCAAESAREAVRAVDGLVRGTLTLGILQRFAATMDLPATLGRFRAEHPGVQIRLVQGGSAFLMDGVREGRLDLAVLGLVDRAPANVTTHVLARDPLVLAFPPGHPMARRTELALSALAGEAFVDFRPGWGLRTLADRSFAAAHVHRNTVCEVNDGPTLLDLVAHGLGIALVPHSASSYEADVRFVRPRPRVATWDVAVAHLGERPDGAAARAMLDALVGVPGAPVARAGRRSTALDTATAAP